MKAVKKPMLSYLDKMRRQKFAKDFKHYPWNKIIFSDEKKFSVFFSDAREDLEKAR